MLDLNHLQQYREDVHIEAKEALGGLPASIWETYSAFANAEGGVILLGVEERPDRSLHALDLLDPQWLIDDFWAIVRDPKQVSVNLLTEADVRIHTVDGGQIISITVPSAAPQDRPVYLKQNPFRETYRRVGESDNRCTREEVEAMLQTARTFQNTTEELTQQGGSTMEAKVYFSREITPEKILQLMRKTGKVLPGQVAIKLHSGEKGNQNFLGPAFWKPVIDTVGGTVVECNTAYEGMRNTTEKHRKLLADHGWSPAFPVDLLDAEGPDLELAIPNGKVIQKNFVGRDLALYDSMLVLSHFKGHPMGGYGGALKQLSIGVASSYGKAYIHGAGVPENIWTADHDAFLESMADAAGSVVDYFRGNLLYVNVMKNMSVDCDCCAVAEDPCIADIGVLVSEDPIAIDQACIDLVYACTDPGRPHLLERIESRNGVHTIAAAAELGYGTRAYTLIEVD